MALSHNQKNHEYHQNSNLYSHTKLVEFAEGEVCLWVEAGSSVMLKAISKGSDPVELEPEIARELGEALIKMASSLK